MNQVKKGCLGPEELRDAFREPVSDPMGRRNQLSALRGGIYAPFGACDWLQTVACLLQGVDIGVLATASLGGPASARYVQVVGNI